MNTLKTEHNFLRDKKILNLYLRWHILRSYRFLAEATFKKRNLRMQVERYQIYMIVIS